MYKDLLNKIKEYDTIIIHRHTKPDGDALGSQMGLKEAILETFKHKKVYAVGDEMERYKFIGRVDEITDETYKSSLAIVLDCGAEHLISDERYKLADYIIKIDHHIPQGAYGDMQIVKQEFESCAGLIAHFLLKESFIITNKAATQLFTGIVTDSGRFRYSSTSSKTFDIASKLYKIGVQSDLIYNNIYSEKLSIIKFRALLVSKFEIIKNVAFLKNTKEDVALYMEKYQVTTFDISRGMVNIMSGIEGIDIWVNFTQDLNDEIYVEIRSNGYNINQIACKYGGGGHLMASGCTVPDFETADRLIKDLNELGEKDAK